MEIASKYNPAEVEGKWYQYWLDNGFFKSKPDGREPYTIVIPPPNVTGVLHMGHMLNNTIQDILVRRARMMGKNACWVPGTDHASIATEAKVVNRLAGQGIKKTDLTRDEFLRHAWEWKEEHGGIILKQLRKLGASCDWEEAFTDNVIMYEFLSELKDIAARPNGITCGCGSHDYSMEIRRDAVELTCRDCGARLRLSAATDRDLDDLCCHMKLVIPGGK